VERRHQPRVAIAVIRAIVDPAQAPVIRILEVRHLFMDDHVVRVTTSPDEAADVIRGWLRDVVAARTP
jgi:hypothetical protein